MPEVLSLITNWGLATRQVRFKYFSYGFSEEIISKIKPKYYLYYEVINLEKNKVIVLYNSGRTIILLLATKLKRTIKCGMDHKPEGTRTRKQYCGN